MSQEIILQTAPRWHGWNVMLERISLAWGLRWAPRLRTLSPAAGLALLFCSVAMLAPTMTRAETAKSIDMKLLVISADGTEPVLAGIKSVLDQTGVPYDVLIAKTTPLNAQLLSDGVGAGRYQGIMLTTGNLGYETATGDFVSALSAAQWQMLWDYQATFKVRQATLYTYPAGEPDNYGLILHGGLDTTTAPQQVTVTAEGKTVFNYINAANPITISNAWTYLATPASSTNPIPLLKTSDGFAIASIYNYPNGRSNLAVTMDGNPNLTHFLALGYGIVNWVSKGVFLGTRKVYLNAQPDDILIEDDMWNFARNTPDGTPFRMTGFDLQQFAAWQNAIRLAHPTAAALMIEMPFNGVGATGIYPNDTLTSSVKLLQQNFRWISHTYTHANLDTISYSSTLAELRKNNSIANNTLGLTNYSKNTMIQPDISGLNNPQFLQAAVDFGIRYILSDTSQPGWDNPSPNTGFYSSYQPSLLILPRRPTNLFYNVSTPVEWVSEYNYFYAPGGQFPYWDHALTYAEILDKESEMMLRYMLKYDVDSLMFHQPNLRAHDGTNSLLGDLINATLIKYEKLFNLPILSPGQISTGDQMATRMAYNNSGVKATLLLGTTNSIVLQTVNAVTVPITGISVGKTVEQYGGQAVSYIKLNASQAMTIAGPAW